MVRIDLLKYKLPLQTDDPENRRWDQQYQTVHNILLLQWDRED